MSQLQAFTGGNCDSMSPLACYQATQWTICKDNLFASYCLEEHARAGTHHTNAAAYQPDPHKRCILKHVSLHNKHDVCCSAMTVKIFTDHQDIKSVSAMGFKGKRQMGESPRVQSISIEFP